MIELAAYLLAQIAGKAGTEAEVKAILAAAGATAADGEYAKVHAAVEGKDLATIIKEGRAKLVNIGGGGGGGGMYK